MKNKNNSETADQTDWLRTAIWAVVYLGWFAAFFIIIAAAYLYGAGSSSFRYIGF